jgi:ABC-2 type transport system ATP-binding protein
VSFHVRRGDVLGYLGPNGSGKSTTVKMLTGLMEPDRGHVLLDGEDIHSDLPGYKRRLGYVPEEPNLYPYLSGAEYLTLVGTLRGIPARPLRAKIDRLMRLFSLYAERHVAMSSYSKGMRQRVLIMAALLHDPDVLIFDEPLSGLDVTSAAIFRNLVRELARGGKVILYCSHVLEVVEKVCSHVLVLNRGRCVAHDSIEHIRARADYLSLEQSFATLVNEPDTQAIAAEIVDCMKSHDTQTAAAR